MYNHFEPSAIRSGTTVFNSESLVIVPVRHGAENSYAVKLTFATNRGYVQEQHTRGTVTGITKAKAQCIALKASIKADATRKDGVDPLNLDIRKNWYVENFYNIPVAGAQAPSNTEMEF